MLRNLVNYLKGSGDVRTPHSVFFYALGYGGWIGVVLFVSLQATCAALMWRAYRITGQSFGIAVWAFSLLGAFFGNVLETPSGAIPFYLILGLVVGPTLSVVGSAARHGLQPSSIAYVPEAFRPEGATCSSDAFEWAHDGCDR
jgi:O-antigen ligase